MFRADTEMLAQRRGVLLHDDISFWLLLPRSASYPEGVKSSMFD
ncbi:hypothetical protein [Streptomyces griseoaurantiacus]